MKLGSQIKSLRNKLALSQDELAEKVFVSRQSISNWENDKTYPDIKSLLLLSEIFSVSLDNLVKGDIEEMKKEIDVHEFAKFQRNSTIFAVLLISIIILPVPLAMLWKWWGLLVYFILFCVTMYYAIRIEKYKKKYDIQTYKEIVTFMERKDLNKIEKAQEAGKRPYQKILLASGSALLVIIVGLIIFYAIKRMP